MEKTVGGRNVFSRTFLPDSVGEENFPSCCGRGNLDVWSRKKVLLGIEIGNYQKGEKRSSRSSVRDLGNSNFISTV